MPQKWSGPDTWTVFSELVAPTALCKCVGVAIPRRMSSIVNLSPFSKASNKLAAVFVALFLSVDLLLTWQGLGFYMLEEHRFGADGRLETIGAGKYRIPSVSCTPLQMNVTLLKDSGNTKAVYSSKVSPTSVINVTFIYETVGCRNVLWHVLL